MQAERVSFICQAAYFLGIYFLRSSQKLPGGLMEQLFFNGIPGKAGYSAAAAESLITSFLPIAYRSCLFCADMSDFTCQAAATAI